MKIVTRDKINDVIIILVYGSNFKFFGTHLLIWMSNIIQSMAKTRVQKKSRLRGSETEEDFAFYVVFEEGLVIFINNSSLATFSIVTSAVKRIVLIQLKFSRHTQCRVKELALLLVVLGEEGL